MCPERPPETAAVRKEPYAEQREAEAQTGISLPDLAADLERRALVLKKFSSSFECRPGMGRGVSIAITHLQEAAMWLNRAHYKKD